MIFCWCGDDDGEGDGWMDGWMDAGWDGVFIVVIVRILRHLHDNHQVDDVHHCTYIIVSRRLF